MYTYINNYVGTKNVSLKKRQPTNQPLGNDLEIPGEAYKDS